MRRGRHRLIGLVFMMVVLLAAGCADENSPAVGDQKTFTPAMLRENKMLRFFADAHPEAAILKFAKADLDADGREDIIVIYRDRAVGNRMCVIRTGGSAWVETNAVAAPVSDQMIQLRDIDAKPPLEFIVQGRKGAKVGYAIFRVENGRLVDVFGEGMQDCC
jgi:hypothetical protein